MSAPWVVEARIRLPSGLESVATSTRTYVGLNPDNVLDFVEERSTTMINGRAFDAVYSKVNNSIETISPMGKRTKTYFDEKGRVVESQVPGYHPVTYTYDAFGRTETVTQGTRTTRYTYDAQGNVHTIRDPLGRTSTTTYDLADRPELVFRPDGKSTSFTYDQNGNLATLTPPDKPAHVFEHDGLDRETQYVPPSLVGLPRRETTSYFTPDRQLDRASFPDGRDLQFTYDAEGRIQSVTGERGPIVFTYDEFDRDKTLSAPGGVVLTFDYDGPLTTQVSMQGPVVASVQNTFDDQFRMYRQKVSGGYPVEYHFDADGAVDHYSVTGVGPQTLQNLLIDHDPGTGFTTGTSVGVVTDEYQYDAYGELQHYVARSNGNVVYEVTYVRDGIGRVDFKTETTSQGTKAFDYEYDTLGRLTHVWEDAVLVEYYEFDSNGNRTLGQVRGTSSVGVYDAQDRMTSYGRYRYTYDETGDLTSRTNTDTLEVELFSYDELGNLRDVHTATGDHIEYLIDGQSRRVGKRVNGQLVQGFVYHDTRNPIAELDASGQIVSRFAYGTSPETPDFVVRGGQTYRVISDQLWSPRALVNVTTGESVQELDYDAWGVVVRDTNPGFQPFGFQGGDYSIETGLTRMGVRDFDATAGRWTTKDPIRFAGGPTSLYVFINNDAVNFGDPAGLGWSDRFKGFVVGAAKALATAVVGAVIVCVAPALVPALTVLGAAGAVLGAYSTYQTLMNWACLSDYEKGEFLGDIVGGLGAGALRAAGKLRFCFVAGTAVMTIDGPKPIEELKVGDLVLSRDEKTEEMAYKPVVQTFVTPNQQVVELDLLDEEGNASAIQATPGASVLGRAKGLGKDRRPVAG